MRLGTLFLFVIIMMGANMGANIININPDADIDATLKEDGFEWAEINESGETHLERAVNIVMNTIGKVTFEIAGWSAKLGAENSDINFIFWMKFFIVLSVVGMLMAVFSFSSKTLMEFAAVIYLTFKGISYWKQKRREKNEKET